MSNGVPVSSAPGGWRWDHSYIRLPEALFVRISPTPVAAPQTVIFNAALADDLGLDVGFFQQPRGAEMLSGNRLPEGCAPIAQAYAGHQYGHFVMLGDGRAHVLGEHLTPDGRRVDVQLKGSGQTPFSRRGDGRAALGPMLREYVISEALHALGIPTTRSLAVVATGETVFREAPRPGAVLTRIAASHLRVGTFEYAAALHDSTVLTALTEYTVARHFPGADGPPAQALLDGVVELQARLVAQWMLVGFVHGVMNTDNMALSGETIDYGPCAFLDAYDTAAVFSSIDQHGRYAYGNQPRIAHWNQHRFAETLPPLLHPEPQKATAIAQEVLDTFPVRFKTHWLAGLRAKLGLFTTEDGDATMIQELLDWMQQARADYTLTFCSLLNEMPSQNAPPWNDPAFVVWQERWQARLARQPQTPAMVAASMRAANPAVIPRNHAVEAALTAAVNERDLAPIHRLVAALRTPFDHVAAPAFLREPPPPGTLPYRTFCGT